MNSRLKSDGLDKLGPEQNSLRARNQDLEKQVVELEISLRKRTKLFTNLSRHLKTLEDQKEISLKGVSKFEPERMTQIEPVMQSKKLVVPKQEMTVADLFGKPVNKVRVQDNSSQTEETCQISTENAKLEATATECAQQLDKQRKIMDKLTAALKKSKFEFKSQTLEDQIQELLLSVKRVPIANQEPLKTCCQSEERKSALRVTDEMRKVKERRQSIHDQRRGLSGDVERFSLDDFDSKIVDCESCASLRNKAIELRSQTTALTDEVDKLKSENKLLDEEVTEMLRMIRNYDESEMELCNKLRKYEQCQKVDKETQASCDLQQKYNALKRLVKLRKREGINTES